jgi:hypothetical protein
VNLNKEEEYMGTRHLICVVEDKKYKVAQYGQWDGYPSGQGITVLNFLKEYDKEHFIYNLNTYVKFGTKEDLHRQWELCGADDSGLVELDVSDKHRELFPENSRDTGAEILSIIERTDKELFLCNSVDFAGDSLFCEWAYIVDFDNNAFEVYEGFNNKQLEPHERFFHLTNDKTKSYTDEIYYPVKLKKSFDLNYLPSEEEFLEKLML